MSERYSVPAVASAIQILAQLAHVDDHGALHGDLVRETGISKSTMHNLLATLEREGYVRRNSRTRGYHLGGALVPLGAAAARQVRSITLAIEQLPSLAREHRVSMAVGQLAPDGDVQIIERAYPDEPLHVGVSIGSRYGPFDGAIGKCLLASMGQEDASALVHSRRIPAHTDRTLTRPATLLKEVVACRRRGWAASIGEYNSNIAVAALFAGSDGPQGALLALGFPNDLQPARVPVIGTALAQVAATIAEVAGATSAEARRPQLSPTTAAPTNADRRANGHGA